MDNIDDLKALLIGQADIYEQAVEEVERVAEKYGYNSPDYYQALEDRHAAEKEFGGWLVAYWPWILEALIELSTIQSKAEA